MIKKGALSSLLCSGVNFWHGDVFPGLLMVFSLCPDCFPKCWPGIWTFFELLNKVIGIALDCPECLPFCEG